MAEDSSPDQYEWDRLSPEAERVKYEFDLPDARARKWAEYIGDAEAVRQKVEQNFGDEYFDIILRRESAMAALEARYNELDRELLTPLRKWRLSRLHHADKDEVFAEYSRRCNVVQDYLILEDGEYKRAKRQIAKTDDELCSRYHSHLSDNVGEALSTKKEKIIYLKREFPYLRTANELVARLADTTYSYAQQVKYLPGEGVRDRQVPTWLRNRTLERDGHSCVRCGSSDELEAHHIVPRSQGGPDDLENMATLCHDCHLEVPSYDDVPEFWEKYATSGREG